MKIQRSTVVFVVVALVFGLMAAAPTMSQGNRPTGVSAADEYVSVDKDVQPVEGECRTYEVTLSILGNPPTGVVDVILVIDNSGSMGEGSPTSMYYAKQAANNFADEFLSPSGEYYVSGNRIGVVSYSTSASLVRTLTSNLTNVHSAINGLEPDSYTNIEAGFNTASSHMASSGNPTSYKAIVLLSDGVANRKGSGSGWSNQCTTWPTSHTNCTIAAYTAGQAAQAQATVYTVGLLGAVHEDHASSETVARETLQWSQNGGYWETFSGADLSDIYEAIGGQVVAAATNVVVNDAITVNFDIVPGSATASQGTVNVVGNDITWTVGSVGSTPATLSFWVTVPEGYSGDLEFNVEATMTYTDVDGNTGQTLTFPNPTAYVPPTLVASASSDSPVNDGNPVHFDGTASGGLGGPYSYQWDFEDDGTWDSALEDPSYTYPACGTYTARLKVSDSCCDKEDTTPIEVICEYDFGDAPDGPYPTSLSSNGPRHILVTDGPYMGAAVDNETDGQPNGLALGDDINGTDDEDGLVDPDNDLDLMEGETPQVRVVVTNPTGSAATLYGWIDFDGDGVFDNATERASAGVAAGADHATVILVFPDLPDDWVESTFARFRLSTDGAAANPTGGASDGEVEDYVVSIETTLVSVSTFGAFEEAGRAVVFWGTSSQIETVGFYLLRLDEATGGYAQVGELIPAMFDSSGGMYYTVDNMARPGGVYTYKLVEIGFGGENVYGPFTVKVFRSQGY